jgi:hypothetical protein
MSSPEPYVRASHAQIRAHIERHVGSIVRDFIDPAATTQGTRIVLVGPGEKRPFHTLITVGVSDQTLAAAGGKDALTRIELMMTLPEDWQLDDEALRQTPWSWPITELFRLARKAREADVPLGWGQAIANGTPPQPFAADTKLCAVILAPSLLVKQEFYELEVDDGQIVFLSAIPLYAEELELWRKHGMEVLFSKLIDNDIKDVVHRRRRNVAKKRFGLF